MRTAKTLIRLGGCPGWSESSLSAPEREVGSSRPTAAVLCPWARHFTPRKYWLITQEAVAPSRHDWKIVDWDVKPQHKQNKSLSAYAILLVLSWGGSHVLNVSISFPFDVSGVRPLIASLPYHCRFTFTFLCLTNISDKINEMSQLMRLWYLSHRDFAVRCSYTWCMEADI